MEFKDATLSRASSDCSRLSSRHPDPAVKVLQEWTSWADSLWDGLEGLALLRREPEMEMNSPTQQSHSLCQCEIGFAREKKCSFIRADFYLNDAFQLNSLKLLLPPQNVSISKQGSLGFFHFADRKRKSIEKACCLFKSHHQPQTARHLWAFIPQAHLVHMASRGLLLLQPLEKEHKNTGRTDTCKSTHI